MDNRRWTLDNKRRTRAFFTFLPFYLFTFPCFGQLSDTLHIAFTGDILLDRGVREQIAVTSADSLFSPSVDSLLARCDVVVGNLECPVTTLRRPVYKRFIFRGEPAWLDVLRRHGFTHLNLANNHSIDQGREGLLDTRRHILQAGMVPVGAGVTLREAAEPVLLSSRPRPVWLLVSQRLPLENFPLLPFKPSVSQESLDTLCRRISTLRSQSPGACILVSLHWGTEHTLEPTLTQRRQAHRIIDAGADAIIGHHTHTFQTVETYRGRPIYYSIGNFIFDLESDINTRACVVELFVTRDTLHHHPHPVVINNSRPEVRKY